MVGDRVSESALQAKQSAEVGQRRGDVGRVSELLSNREPPLERVERTGKISLRPIGKTEPVPGVGHAGAVAHGVGAVAGELIRLEGRGVLAFEPLPVRLLKQCLGRLSLAGQQRSPCEKQRRGQRRSRVHQGGRQHYDSAFST